MEHHGADENTALDAALLRDSYQQPALIPASPRLDGTPPTKPKLNVAPWKKSVTITWKNDGNRTRPLVGFAVPDEHGLDHANFSGDRNPAVTAKTFSQMSSPSAP
ncbi:MAG: hypothetical protein WDN00_09830 [Limisphaerales bacterium]